MSHVDSTLPKRVSKEATPKFDILIQLVTRPRYLSYRQLFRIIIFLFAFRLDNRQGNNILQI